jgi:hypothetical protein
MSGSSAGAGKAGGTVRLRVAGPGEGLNGWRKWCVAIFEAKFGPRWMGLGPQGDGAGIMVIEGVTGREGDCRLFIRTVLTHCIFFSDLKA